ncbi:glycosyltransferase [Cytophagaceae bacterium ABcell3]|nr:glycosyltransferase [Cytophagaceae bacterium ABcell3]
MRKFKKIVVFCPYPVGSAPGQRFRYEQYLDFLKESYVLEIIPFLDQKTNDVLYKSGHYFQKLIGVLKGFLFRFFSLPKAISADFIFVFREASPVGLPLIEWLLVKVFRKRIIYDFDDAIWLPNTSTENKVATFFKFHQKVESICRWSYKVSCGNRFLAAYASSFNDSVIVNPTTIDTQKHHNQLKEQATDKVVIGWTGTHSTIKYLSIVAPVLDKLSKNLNIEIVIICNKKPSLGFDFTFIPWTKAQEIEDLLKINIGIMPLSDDEWTKGKCGFKALQYMALGIPAVVSPVGVNVQIVDHAKNGFHCNTEESWYNTLVRLIKDVDLRREIGRNAREKVIENYSVESNKDNFLSLFK